MKHYFIINPAAGGGKFARGLSEKINDICEKLGVDYHIHLTKERGEATEYVRRKCEETPKDERVRFYSCGGDGTNYEVISGVVDHEHAEVGFIPSGTGNDFIRCFTEKENFHDIEAQINGECEYIDLIKCNKRYILNMMNTGFDCEVAKLAGKLKTKPLISKSTAYIMGVVEKLVKKPTTGFKVSIDGGEWADKSPLLLATFSNGRYCGGGFHSSPKAHLQSGFIDACFIKDISRTKFVSIVGQYRSGEYLFNEKLSHLVEYVRAKKVSLDFGERRNICIDGEIFKAQRVDLEILPLALKIILPRGTLIAPSAQ